MTFFWLVILRIVCIVQLIAATFQSLMSLIGLIQDGALVFLFQSAAFALIAALPVQVFQIFNNNYPDKPIEGRQKRNFNRLFLINFLLLALLFGFVFYDFQMLYMSGERDFIGGFSSKSLFDLILSCIMLVFQLVILYGLFWLRSTISANVNRKQFDFEMKDENI